MKNYSRLYWEEVGSRFLVLRDSAVVIVSSLLLGLLAHLEIPLPFSPVPIVLQAHVALLLGAILGSKRGTLAVLSFLAQGAFGLPVFAGGGAGLVKFLGPTGGYLVGYAFAAYVVGWLFERMQERNYLKSFAVFAVGNLVIYVMGASYLSTLIGVQKAFLIGVLPFILGDSLKIVALCKVIEWISKRRECC